jgi:hypothetical protein
MQISQVADKFSQLSAAFIFKLVIQVVFLSSNQPQVWFLVIAINFRIIHGQPRAMGLKDFLEVMLKALGCT